MKREITPDMYNYNKYPGPKFERLMDQVRSEDISLTLVDNYKEAFNLTAFEQRFTTFMLKFDYIVGDWGNEQLRLKGFYKDENTRDSTLKISHLEDYLLEFCNYGCAYFVLENPTPQEPEVEVEEPRVTRNRDNGRRRRPRNRQNQEKNGLSSNVQDRKHRESQTRSEKNAAKTNRNHSGKSGQTRRRNTKSNQDKRHFDIKPDRRNDAKASTSRSVKREVNEGKRDFVIRQK
ncbi:YutD family protein [Streptococcus merionis]|uniref:Transcriptional regulator n=1 Tax=Streptococcus merionis TaxID=400065 RepID=A0A239SKP9_9STRE|nr:YutD-like domain-containing protein [Streptococcus merionis]SNU85961.1 transcriptional regulator [Streptococcus merionis]